MVLVRFIVGLFLIALHGTAGARLAAQLGLDTTFDATTAAPRIVRVSAPPAPDNVIAASEGAMWVAARGTLGYIFRAGHTGASIDFEALEVGSPRLLAIDPYDDSIWVATTQNLLVSIDTDGMPRQGWTLPETPAAIAVALDQTLWVAFGDELAHLDRDGRLLGSHAFTTGAAAAIGLAVDALHDRVWIVRESGIEVVDTLDSSWRTQAFDEPILSAALDPRAGQLWVLKGSTLAVYDSRTELVALLGAGTPAEKFDALGYDGTRDVFVLASPSRWVLLDRERRVVQTINLEQPGNIPGMAPFRLLPEIALAQDAPARLPGERAPSLQLDVRAVCNDTRCDVGDEYLAALRIFVVIDGNPAEVTVEFDPTGRRTSVTPAIDLLPGDHHVSLHAVDRFGHVSNGLDTTLSSRGHAAGPTLLKANQAPQVSLTAPTNNATFVPGSGITLIANASDADGSIQKVEFFRSNTLIGTAIVAPWSIVWSSVPAGNYALTAKATDDKGATKTSGTVNITVRTPPNVAPTIAITTPASGSTVNGPVVAVVATAGDADGMVTKVDFYDGAALLGTVAGGSASVRATWNWTNVPAGPRTLKATATDNTGAATSATVSFTVNAAPYAVVTAPLPCSEVISPADVTLAADALDADGSVARVDFYSGATLLGSADRAPYRFLWAKPPVGIYSVTAVAVDNLGASRSSNPLSFSVQGPDVPPTVAVTSPVSGARFAPGASIPLAASANDSDGSIRKVEFYAGASLVATATTTPYASTWAAPAVGSYVITAKAYDNRGVSTTSAPVSIAVANNVPPTVTLAMPAGGPVFAVPSTVTLVATAGDTDGVVRKVEFLSGPSGSIPSTLIGTAAAPPYSVAFTIAQAGASYYVMARATDDLGSTANSAILTLRGNAPPSVTMLSPADNTLVLPGSTVTVAARVSDADGLAFVMAEGYVNGKLKWNSAAWRRDSSTDTFTFPPALFTAGSAVILFVQARDVNGVQTYSKPIRVNFAPAPTVQLLTPVAGDSFTAPATIRLTASASQPLGKIVKVVYYDGSAPIGSATTPPYEFIWSNVSTEPNVPPSIPRYIHAEAIDDLGTGGVGRSADAAIIVDLLRLAVTSPAADAVFYSSPIQVKGTYDGGTPGRITVNGIDASFGNGTFSATVPLTSGGNLITVVATTSRGTITREIGVSFARPSIKLTSPTELDTFVAPTTIEIAAAVENFDRPIKRVEFWVSGKRVGTADTAPYRTFLPVVNPGLHRIGAKAIDADDRELASADVYLNVKWPPGVTITRPVDNAVFPEGADYAVVIHSKPESGRLKQMDILRNGEVARSLDLGNSEESEVWAYVNRAETGSYIYAARVTDDSGRVMLSTPIHVEIAGGPSVELVMPAADTRFKSPAQIKLGARALSSAAEIARVEFFADDVRVATATSAPYLATWSNVPNGAYEVFAKAIGTDGKTAVSSISSIIVDDVALNIELPVQHEVVYEPSIVVGGTVSAAAPDLMVTVNGKPAITGSGTYATTLPLPLGTNVINVLANVGGVTRSRIITVTREEPSIAFFNIPAGTIVHDDTVMIRGSVRAPQNSALFIKGLPANVAPDGTFYVNSVPLANGANTIPVKLVRQDGTTIDWSVPEIVRDAVQPFQIAIAPDSGLDHPLETTLTLTRRGQADYGRVVQTENGVTFFEEIVNSDKDERRYRITFNDYGTHYVTTRLLDASGGEVYARTVAVRIAHPDEIDTDIRNLYSRTIFGLLAGGFAAATTAFSPPLQPAYQSLFTLLGNDVPKMTDLLREVSSVTFGATFGEIMLKRNTADGIDGHPVGVARDDYGIWRLSGM